MAQIVTDSTTRFVVPTKAQDTGRHIVVGSVHGNQFYHETDAADASREAVVGRLLAGEYVQPLRIIAIDEAAGTVANVSYEIAREIARRVVSEHQSIDRDTLEFIHAYGCYLDVEEAA